MGLRLELARQIGRGPHFKGRSRLMRLLARHDRFEPFSFQEPYFGLIYAGDFRNFVDWNVYFYGAHERHNLVVLERLARDHQMTTGTRPVCWDVGANSGAFALFLSRFAQLVCAFEPVSGTRAGLERNIAVNGLANVSVCPYALGASEGVATIHVPPRPIDCANASLVVEVAAQDWTPEQVRVAAGDDLIAAGMPAPDIIKLDVEGFERDVLQGLRKTLDEKRPAILMELSEPGRRRFGSEDELRASLYRQVALFSISRRGDLLPFDYARTFDVVAMRSEHVST